MNAEEKLKAIIRENKILKEQLGGNSPENKAEKNQEEEDKMKETNDVDKDIQSNPASVSGKGAPTLNKDAATQDDMNKKYEESEDMDSDEQTNASESPSGSATQKIDGASQDDMNVKYEEEVDKDSQAPADAAVDGETKLVDDGASQDNMSDKNETPKMESEDEETIEESDDEKTIEENEGSDMGKIVEILERLKEQQDGFEKRLSEMECGESNQEEMPEAPISEKLRHLKEKVSDKQYINLINKL